MSLWSLSRALSLSCFPVHLCHSFLFCFFYALLHHWLLFHFPVLSLNRVHHLWHAWYVRQLFWNPSFILKSGAPTLGIHILFFWRKNGTFNFKHEPNKRTRGLPQILTQFHLRWISMLAQRRIERMIMLQVQRQGNPSKGLSLVKSTKGSYQLDWNSDRTFNHYTANITVVL